MRLLALVPLLSLVIAGDDSVEVILPDEEVRLTEGPNSTWWACDIRAWSRGADLSPGAHIPVDARLSLNGTECGDIVRWEAGIRLKERAILKKRAEGAVIPTKPQRPRFNSTRRPSADWNDLFQPLDVWGFNSQDGEYQQALEAYNEQIRDEKLWFVKGQHLTVFDLTKEMDLPVHREEYFDVIQSFAIHVPWTNFPPSEQFPFMSSRQNEMIGSESVFEHYHLLHHRNGTIIDIPSGRSSFVPLPNPERDDRIAADLTWPRDVPLLSPRYDDTDESDPEHWSMNRQRGPDCDRGNGATFNLSVKSNITRPILGQNMTFDITLRREGNGSEYPAFIDIGTTTERNVSWAYQYVEDEEYRNITGARPGLLYEGIYEEMKITMLQLPDEQALQKDLSWRETMRQSGIITTSAGYWMPPMDGYSRFDFWQDNDEPKEEHSFSIEVQIPRNVYPTFDKMFESLRSALDIKLHTIFACELAPDSPGSEGDKDELADAAGLGYTAEDDEWTDYKLPLKPTRKRLDPSHFGRQLTHRATVPLEVQMPSPCSTPPTHSVKHYLDSEALGPLLSDNVDDEVVFPSLQLVPTEETGDELRRSRWGYNSRPFGWCGRGSRSHRCANGGGAQSHAASMWQSKMAKLKEAESSEAKGSEKGPGLVVQV